MVLNGENKRAVILWLCIAAFGVSLNAEYTPVPPNLLSELGQQLQRLDFAADADDLSKSSKWDNYREKISDARRVVQQVKDAGNFISKLSGNQDLISLPVGIQVGSPDGSFMATMVIEEIKIFQNYTQLFAILEIEAAIFGEQPLIFYSPDLKYSAQAGIIGDATIALLADYPVNMFDKKAMLVFKGGKQSLSRPDEARTFARIGCDGFESLNIAGEVVFSRDWMLPVYDPDIPRQKTRVTASFNIQDITHPSEIYVELDIDRFSITSMSDFQWKVQGLALDLSERQSPDYIKYAGDVLVYETLAGPKYHELVETGKLWKGFYAREIEVTIPDKLTADQTITFEARDLIIDHSGVSVYARVASDEGLLSFGEANLNGWAFSIDGFEIIVTENINWAVQFGGLIFVPVFSDTENSSGVVQQEDALNYVATIDPENGYLFTTGPATEKNMDLWLASATILPSTSISLGYSRAESSIVARAVINANIGISTSLGEDLDIELPQLGVRDLIVQNTGTPIVLNTSRWELINNSPVNLGVFEFGFDSGDEELLTSATNSTLPQPSARIDLKSFVKLSRSDNLTGRGGFEVEGELIENEGIKRWVNKDFRLKEVFVSGENVIPGLEYLEGSLLFYKEHPTYGSGFRGALTLGLKSVIREARAIAQFGTYVEHEKPKEYYFIDLSATFDRGAPLGGAVYLRGIGGGIYKNMVRPDVGESFDQISYAPLTPAFFTDNIGASMSGIQYTVDRKNKSFGFRAMAILSSPPTGSGSLGMQGESNLFSANLEYGMQFKKTAGIESTSYGLQLIYLQGVGQFMGEMDIARKVTRYLDDKVLEAATSINADDLNVDVASSRPSSAELPIPSAAVSAKVLIQAKLDCPEIHGLFGLYINAGILYGIAHADMLIKRGCDQEGDDPGIDWHIFLGTIDAPILLGLNVPILGDLLTIKAYLMAGNEGIPTSLPPPLDYIEIFDEALLANKYGGYPGGPYPNPTGAIRGTGFATGMAMRVGTPPEGLKFLFMYATLQGGLGFDMMVNKNILSDCYDEVGINGWYGKGQAWLYANAEIGAAVKLGFLQFRIKAFQAAAGAMLRVEGPNPFYGQGRLDAKLNLLGMLSADVKFKVTLGSSLDDLLSEECQSLASPLDVPIIENVYPLLPASGGAYPRNTSFIVELNYDLDQIISDPEDIRKKYRVVCPMESEVIFPYEGEQADPGDIGIVDDENPIYVDPNGTDDDVIGFSQWFSIKDEALRDIPFTYRAYPNAYGGSNYLVTPVSPMPGNNTIIIRPKAFILNVEQRIASTNPDGTINTHYNYSIVDGYIEEPVYTFETLPALEDYIIHDEEILVSYPVKDMKHFYPEMLNNRPNLSIPENTGYWITLNTQKPFLIENIPGGYELKGRMVDVDGNIIGETMEVDRVAVTKKEMYVFSDNVNLNTDTNYALEMVYVYVGSEENPALGSEHVICTIPFTTSKYRTLEAKLVAMTREGYSYVDNDGDRYSQGDWMEWQYRVEEGFDRVEIGETKTSSLLHLQFNGENCRGLGGFSAHEATCQLYRFFDLCSKELLPEHLWEHPKMLIDYGGWKDGILTFTSQLPASIFRINTFVHQYFMSNGCGTMSGPNPGNIGCNSQVLSAFCDETYDYPFNPEGGVFPLILDYTIPYGDRPYIKLSHTMDLNADRP